MISGYLLFVYSECENEHLLIDVHVYEPFHEIIVNWNDILHLFISMRMCIMKNSKVVRFLFVSSLFVLPFKAIYALLTKNRKR